MVGRGGADAQHHGRRAQTRAITATYRVSAPATPSFVQVGSATPQSAMSTVSTRVRQGPGRRRPQRRRGRVERRHRKRDFGHRQRRQRLPARRRHGPRQRHQPGDLLRQEHRGRRGRRQHRDGEVRQGGGVRRRPRARIRGTGPGEPARHEPARPRARARRRTAERRPRRPPPSWCSVPGRPPAGSAMPAAASRGASSPFPTRDIAEDRNVTTAGSYSAAAPGSAGHG